MHTNEIGIFFIKKNSQIILQKIPYDKVTPMNDLYDYGDAKHSTLFDKYPDDFYTGDYIYVPRGRVIFDGKKNRSIIFLDKCYISNKKVVATIIKSFELDNYILQTESHYRCTNCTGDLYLY